MHRVVQFDIVASILYVIRLNRGKFAQLLHKITRVEQAWNAT